MSHLDSMTLAEIREAAEADREWLLENALAIVEEVLRRLDDLDQTKNALDKLGADYEDITARYMQVTLELAVMKALSKPYPPLKTQLKAEHKLETSPIDDAPPVAVVEPRKNFNIVLVTLNGRSLEFIDGYVIKYGRIVELTGHKHEDVLTVTFAYARRQPGAARHTGTITQGESLRARHGLVINATITGNS